MPAPIEQQITFLYVRDLNASAAFYAGILRLPLARDQGPCRIFRTAPNAYLGICQREDVSPAPQGLIVTLVTDDVEGWYALALAAGAHVEGPPAHNDHYRITHCFLRDPDGYCVELQRFDDRLD
ncbi:MAG TPA: VOC family protein [Candidatus Limnocylindrales bacterium]|nr:VOC family protein [Candidatus Limnocylindrales bacterium]